MCTFTWDFDRDLGLWSEVGTRYAGLLHSKLAQSAEDKLTRLTAADIRASTLITEAFSLSAPDTWDDTHRVHRSAIDLMAESGGQSVYFTPGRTTGEPWRDVLARLKEAAAPTVAYGLERGVSVAIEPSLRTSVSFVNTLRDALHVAEHTGLKLVADFGNMWMERDLAEVLEQAMPVVALVQLTDVVIGSTANSSGIGRAHIGQGELPVRRMVRDILEAGYEGVFDLEVVPADFAAGPDEKALRSGIAAASSLLAEMGI